MYNIGIPLTIRRIMAMFFHLKMWRMDDEANCRMCGRKLFYYFYMVAFTISLALGVHLTDDKEEQIFLAVASILFVVLIYKMTVFLWKENSIFLLLDAIGAYSTIDEGECSRINSKLKMFMQFVKYFQLMIFISFIAAGILFPLVNEKRTILVVAFPLNQSNSEIVTWMVFAFTTGGFIGALVVAFFTQIVWYLLYSFVLKYEMLGNQFKEMGTIRTRKNGRKLKVSMARQQTLYVHDLAAAIQKYDDINGKLKDFVSIFGNLFFLQIATSSLCICGSVYCLAFTSHESFIQDGIYCLMLAYCFFEIFVIMYLANDIKYFSGRLLYCLFESDWLEQTQSTKVCILILGERLKRPQEIIVGKIYPLNLVTFNSIVNSAYSLFNILRNSRK